MSTNKTEAVILSQSIIFRHGARGPGDSELKSWDSSHNIVSQWRESEIENLTDVGADQMFSLGSWFGLTCLKRRQKIKCLFSCSKSSRAQASGHQFLTAFTSVCNIKEEVDCTNATYSVDPDYYYRPWKIYPDIEQNNKSRRTTPKWIEKAQECEDLLTDLANKLEMKDTIKSRTELILWGITHVFGLLLCEKYWSNEDRSALHRLLPEGVRHEIADLACWVWKERFMSGYQIDMGGWIFLEMIQKTCDYSSHNVNIFSAHDYTIMSLLSCTGVIDSLPEPLEWGCYIILQLCYDIETNTDSNSNNGTTYSNDIDFTTIDTSKLYIRLVFNSHPFEKVTSHEYNTTTTTTDHGRPLSYHAMKVHDEREVVLKIFTLSEIRGIIDTICTTLVEHNRSIPPEFTMPAILS